MTLTIKALAMAAVLSAGGLSAGLAQARDVDVQWSITIGSPVYHRPAHVVVAAPPIYVPAPAVYVRAPVYGQRVVLVPAQPRAIGYHSQPHSQSHSHAQRPTRRDMDGDGIPNRHDQVYNPRWDRDGDGVPNRHDRAHHPRWDRDGDGVPNRHDRAHHPRWDRDGDGVPNRRDAYPQWPGRY